MADRAARNRALLDWYRTGRRRLPWRETDDPWAILVSEIMAQQTQVARVVPAWERFLARYPDPAALAGSDPAELVLIWDGLGYQRRAFRLREAAAMLAADGWPTDVVGLLRLPGVGPYTAAAVACFAFGVPVPAVDTNLRRVLSRWTGTPLALTEAQEVADDLIDRDGPAAWNQAIMDLAAGTCRPARPRCGECPVRRWCADPTVTVRVPRQAPYEGSVRQARAAILRVLATRGPCTGAELASTLRLDAERLETAVAALAREGRVERVAGRVGLVGQSG